MNGTVKRKNLNLGQIGVNIACILVCIITVAPFVLVVTSSLTNEDYLMRNGYSFFVEQFDSTAYKYIWANISTILNAYKVTAIFSFVSMISSVVLMSMIAYPLARDIMPAKKWISFFLYFTMLFSGGLVPTYILITKYLNLGDTIWVYILPSMISPWYVFMMRTSFQGIPKSIIESAYIDGASEYTIYARFILPMSKPVLATVALFVFLTKWNDWYTCMLYINDSKLTSLQYLLQKILLEIEMFRNGGAQAGLEVENIPGESIRMALAVVVAGPALLIFPFFQKYFTKGMTVGSVKG